SAQPPAQPVNNNAAPNSPIESNSPQTHLQHTVAYAPQPVSSAQESPHSSTHPNAQDSSLAGNTSGVQSQPDTQPIGETPQALGTRNILENISGNESSPTEATAIAAVTVALTSGTSLPDAKPDSSSLSGNRTDPSSTMPSNGPQEATVAGSGSALRFYGQSTAQSVQNVQAQSNYISDTIQGHRGGLDGSGQSFSGEQTPSTPSSKLPSGTVFVAEAGIVGAAALTGYLAATDASSSSDTSDAENAHFNGSREDSAGHWDDEFDGLSSDHQQPDHDNSDIEGVHSAASLTNSDDEEASGHVAEDYNVSQPDSLSHYGEIHRDLFSGFDVQNDLHEHQLQSYENSDNELSHEAMEGNSYKQNSGDGEDDEENVQPHDSDSQEESFDNGVESGPEDGHSVNADFLEPSDDNQQDNFALDSYSDVSSHHSAEVEVLSQDEDQDQDQDNNSSDHGFDNESENGESYQESSPDSEQDMQGDTEDGLDAESSQEDSGHETESEAAQNSDQSQENDSDQNSDDDNGSDLQSSYSSEDDPEDSPVEEDDESTEEEQSDPEPDDSEPDDSEPDDSEDISEPEEGRYSDSGGGDNAFYSD
ncbi:hypothetical protein FOXB_14807, partial [Fusarium oxysporum f. sp. conglutinans Fo5176]